MYDLLKKYKQKVKISSKNVVILIKFTSIFNAFIELNIRFIE